MTIFRQLAEKPWSTEQGRIDDQHDGSEFSLPRAKVGLRVLLVVMSILFSLSIVAYADRMIFPDWRPLPEPWLLWLNTALLICSSVGLQWARTRADRDEIAGVKQGLFIGGVSAFAFLAGQLVVWRQLVELGYFADTNPANAFFYMFTGLHGLHLLGGLAFWARTNLKLRRGVKLAQLRMTIELCAIYWHFLLAVWLVLFTLMLFT